MDWLSQLQIVGEVTLAMFLGGLIGIERELADKPAGFRTHMMVCGTSALLVGLGNALLERFSGVSDGQLVRFDPVRIVQSIVTGVSFLCAGTIFRRGHKGEVQGLTTAATILLVSAIGITVAVRQWIIAIAITLLTLIILRGLGFVEKRIEHRRNQRAQQARADDHPA